jgi:hypothetical protein
MLSNELSNEQLSFICYRVADMPTPLLSGCRHAHAAILGGSAAMRWLRRAALGTGEIAFRTAQNLPGRLGGRAGSS